MLKPSQPYQISLSEIIGLTYLVLILLAAGLGIFVYWGGLNIKFLGPILLGGLIFSVLYFLFIKKYHWRDSLRHLIYFAGIAWPLLLLAFNYVNLRVWKTPGITLLDNVLMNIDKSIFGGTNIHATLGQFNLPTLEFWLAFSYLAFFGFYVITPLVLYDKDNQRATRDIVLSITLISYLSFIWYHFWPAAGPWRFFSGDYATTLGTPISQFLTAIVQKYGNGVDALPSLHAGITAIFMYYLYKYNRRFFWWTLPILASVYPATIYLRFHYVTDIIAGVVVAALVLWLTPKLNDWWFDEKSS